MARTVEGWVAMWSRPSGLSGISSRLHADKAKAVAEVKKQQADIDADVDGVRYYVGERMFLAYVEMDDDWGDD